MLARLKKGEGRELISGRTTSAVAEDSPPTSRFRPSLTLAEFARASGVIHEILLRPGPKRAGRAKRDVKKPQRRQIDRERTPAYMPMPLMKASMKALLTSTNHPSNSLHAPIDVSNAMHLRASTRANAHLHVPTTPVRDQVPHQSLDGPGCLGGKVTLFGGRR